MDMSENNEIAVSQTRTPEEQAVWDAKAKVRVLLNLWDLGGGKMTVKKGELTKRIVRTNETSVRYRDIKARVRAVRIGVARVMKSTFSKDMNRRSRMF